ncbi:MAG: DUF805 domain-containing protein [Burkholderiaceae bacterium]|nr:DUF805 domain-containing protein [Burkholderiaceae bacterium]
MEFTNWYLDVLKNKYAKFDGRAGRPEYWFFVLCNVIVVVVLDILIPVKLVGLLASALLLIYGLATLVPAIAVGVRRLHDIDRSGWWMLIVFVPLIGGIVLLVFAVLPGTQGNNRFGPPAPASPGQ